jgi:hypothetical protein
MRQSETRSEKPNGLLKNMFLSRWLGVMVLGAFLVVGLTDVANAKPKWLRLEVRSVTVQFGDMKSVRTNLWNGVQRGQAPEVYGLTVKRVKGDMEHALSKVLIGGTKGREVPVDLIVKIETWRLGHIAPSKKYSGCYFPDTMWNLTALVAGTNVVAAKTHLIRSLGQVTSKTTCVRVYNYGLEVFVENNKQMFGVK